MNKAGVNRARAAHLFVFEQEGQRAPQNTAAWRQTQPHFEEADLDAFVVPNDPAIARKAEFISGRH